MKMPSNIFNLTEPSSSIIKVKSHEEKGKKMKAVL
jgi:hypothetical protein